MIQLATIKTGWGYHEEYNGNLTGSFHRVTAPTGLIVTVVQERYQGKFDDVLVRLPNGHMALTKRQAFTG